MNERPIFKMLIDNGFTVNVMPTRIVRALKKSKEDLLSSKVIVVMFTRDVTKALGVLPLEKIVRTKKFAAIFFAVDSLASYQALLSRD